MSTATFTLNGAGTYTLQSCGGAVLTNVSINTGASGGSVALYDAVNGTTASIGSVQATGPVGITYNTTLKNGLTAVVTGAVNVTVTVSSASVTGAAASGSGGSKVTLPLAIASGGTGTSASPSIGSIPESTSTSSSAWYGTDAVGPWVFPVTAYNSFCNGQISNTGAANGSATVTIGESVLTQGDVGKAVMAKNTLQNRTTAGQTTSVGVITAVNSPTSFTATWNTTPTQTVTGLQVLWGNDDSTAIQAAINAANAYASLTGYAEVFFPIGGGLFYTVANALQNTNGANSVYNSQLTVPIQAEQSNGATIMFRGVTGSGGQTRYWNQNTPTFTGSTLVSFGNFVSQASQQTNVTNGGNPSVIGGGTGKFTYGNGTPTPLYSNTCLVLQDLTVLTTHSNSGWTYGAVNAYGIARFGAKNFTYGTTGVIELYNGNNGDFSNVTLLSGGQSIGVIMPSSGNNARNVLQNVVCNGGYTYGLFATEHTVGNAVTILYSWSGLCLVGNYNDSGANAVSALHAIKIDQACIESCTYHINVIGAGAAGIGPIVDVVMDTEGTVQLRDSVSGSNTGVALAAAKGTVKLAGSPSTVGVSTGSGTGAAGGTGLSIIKQQNATGVITGPSLTANTPVMNNTWRNVDLVLSGGTTVTTVQVSSLAGGVSSVPVSTVADFTAGGTIPAGTSIPVGPGQWVQVNCAALPSAVWVAS